MSHECTALILLLSVTALLKEIISPLLLLEEVK